MSTLEREIAAYNAKLPELLQHMGRYVLIRGSELQGIFDTYEAALIEGYKNGPDKPFLVKKIAPSEQIAYFTRDLTLVCQ